MFIKTGRKKPLIIFRQNLFSKLTSNKLVCLTEGPLYYPNPNGSMFADETKSFPALSLQQLVMNGNICKNIGLGDNEQFEMCLKRWALK